MAQPGEFTLRAFLNGQMDLSQAEAVADLIASSSESSHNIAINQMRGGFSDKIKELRQQLVDFASLVELELDFGVIGFKRGGGLGGHNGLRSTASCLGTRDFNRLRLGISRPPHSDITSYVLGPFSSEERIVLPTYLEEAAKLLEDCLTDGFGAMEKPYRKKQLLQEF